MTRIAEMRIINKHSQEAKPVPSELGKKLRRLSEKIAASGEKMLTRRQLERELSERRGGVR